MMDESLPLIVDAGDNGSHDDVIVRISVSPSTWSVSNLPCSISQASQAPGPSQQPLW